MVVFVQLSCHMQAIANWSDQRGERLGWCSETQEKVEFSDGVFWSGAFQFNPRLTTNNQSRNWNLLPSTLYNSKTYRLYVNRKASSPTNEAPNPIPLWLALKSIMMYHTPRPTSLQVFCTPSLCVVYTLYTRLVSRPTQHVSEFSKGFPFSDSTHSVWWRYVVRQY